MKAIEVTPPAGRRVYVEGGGGIRVPMREIELETPNPPVRVYDTSGPYGDPDHVADPAAGLPAIRTPWISGRSGSRLTQMHYARRGEITPPRVRADAHRTEVPGQDQRQHR